MDVQKSSVQIFYLYTTLVMANNFVETVTSLYKQNKWEEILNLKDCDSNSAHGVLWVWPSKENLYFIQKHLFENGCDGVTSIGCGCGLFEWLLQICTGVSVNGYEVNEKWWNSKYSNPQFIKLQFAEPFPRNCPSVGKAQALLFCYFNSRKAFLTYLQRYKGSLLFIIGPGKGRYTHTEPEPFMPKFESLEWVLLDFQEIRTSKDYIAVYKRV